MTNNFMDNVRLEVETEGILNMLPVSASTVAEEIFSPTINNQNFATNTADWTAGSGWTLARLAGPPTKGRLTKSASVTVGQVLIQNTQHIAAAPGQVWNLIIDIMRVSTSPASANMELRVNLVAYNASNVRLGVVTGSTASADVTIDPGNINVDGSYYIFPTAVTPAATSYLMLEVSANNAWTYVATPFELRFSGYLPGRVTAGSVSGWTGHGFAVMPGDDGGWDLYRNGAATPDLESDKVAIVPDESIAVAADIKDFSVLWVPPYTITPHDVQIGVRYYNSSNVFISEDFSVATPGVVVAPYQDQYGNPPFDQPFPVRVSFTSTPPVGAAKASLVAKFITASFNETAELMWAVMIQGTSDEVADTSYATTLPANASNKIINPSGELGVQGWTDYGSASVLTTRASLPANSKGYGFLFGDYPPYSDYGTGWNWEEPVGKEIIVAQVTGGYNALYSNTTPVTAGQWVGGRAICKGRGLFPPSGSYIISYVSVGWQFRNAADAVISTVLSDSVLVQNDYYRYIKAPVMVAPAGTVRARMVIQNSGDSASFTPSNPGAWMMVKQAQMNVGANAASVTNQPLAYAEHWKNILGGTHSIEIDRKELDTGLMTAEVLEPTLDPAEFDTLAPGLKARLRTLVDDVWQTTFTGTITNCQTGYDVDHKTGELKPRINIQVADDGAKLANTIAPNTVATIDGLANNLSSDILWNINGQTAVGTNPTVVGFNPNATILDQVYITRDTVGGYAWVDRTGVFNAWDAGAFSLYKDKINFSDQARPTVTSRNENLILNPTFNSGTATWTGAGGVLTWNAGAKAATHTATGGVSAYIYATDYVYVGVGHTIAASINATVTAGKGWKGHLIFYDISGTEISRIDTDSLGQVTTTVPAGTYKLRLAIDAYNAPTGTTAPSAGTVLTVNSVMLVEEPDTWSYDYFDGDSDYAYWTGAVHASTSVRDFGLYQDYLTNIDIGYNTAEIINQVVVNVSTKNAEGSYEDVAYGPYQDTTSVANFGPSQVQINAAAGVTPSTIGARILASNATPELQVHSVTFLVDDLASFNKAASIDLYDQVNVALSGKMNKAHRVSGISHVLTAGIRKGLSDHRWEVTLFFKALDTAAQISGAAPSSSLVVDPGPVFAKAHINANIGGIPSGAYTNITGWTLDESSGVSHSSGVFTVTKTGLYLIVARLQYALAAGFRIGVRLNYNGTASGPVNLSPSGAASSVSITQLVELNAGNTVRIMTFQDSGAATTLGGDSVGTWSDVNIRWIGE